MSGAGFFEDMFKNKGIVNSDTSNTMFQTKKGKKEPCENCKLYTHCTTPKFEVAGNGQKRILIIDHSPNKEEDAKGQHLLSKSSSILARKLKVRGINIGRDCWYTYAVNCRVAEADDTDTVPERKHIEHCEHRLVKTIKDLKPTSIWLLGSSAISSYFWNRASDSNPERWRSRAIPDYARSAWVFPMYNPEFLTGRNERDLGLQNLFDRNISLALEKQNTPLPKQYPKEDNVCIIKDCDSIIDLLKNILEHKPLVVHDYETSGLKPYQQGHIIASISVTLLEYGHKDIQYDVKGYSFPFQHRYFTKSEQRKIKKYWRMVLADKEIKKVAHNLKFEDAWGKVITGVRPENWLWCSMIVSHILDNRSKTTSLKFQTSVRWGVFGYDEKIKPYLQSKQDSEFNRIEEAPLDNLLEYGGLDAIFTAWLFQEQLQVLGGDLSTFTYSSELGTLGYAVNLFVEGLQSLGDVQDNGILIDPNYYTDKKAELTTSIDGYEKLLIDSEENKKFRGYAGRDINPSSPEDLKILFYELLSKTIKKKTKSGAGSVDEEVLSKFDLPWADTLVKMKKLLKIRDTYFGQFEREVVYPPSAMYNGKQYGVIHPFFDLHIPITYRSSSSNPNFQNIPKRDKTAKIIVRSGIIPRPGNMLCEVDYGGLEVAIMGIVSGDKVLLEYLHNSSADMHKDSAASVFCTTADNIPKDIRQEMKSGFVFATFYGSWYLACAEYLYIHCWDMELINGVKICDHMKMSKEDFIEHMKLEEAALWNKYNGLKKWQESNFVKFQKHGWISNPHGFRFISAMTENDIRNYPIQSTGFHFLLWSLTRVNKSLKEMGLRSMIIGQIHDSLILDIVPTEKEQVLALIRKIMTQSIREEFTFINAPLNVDVELTPINDGICKTASFAYLDDE